MRRVVLTIAIGLALAVPGSLPAQASQATPGGRGIDLPDTNGAAFSIADSAAKSGSVTDYDFLVGMWHFTFQQRNRDGSFRPPFAGHWFVTRRDVTGAMIEDHWRPDNNATTWESGTYTFRVFDPARNLWTIQGVDSNRGVWQPGLSWSDKDNRYLIQHNRESLMRIRYFAIQANRFRWRADISLDGGRTWIADWWSMDVRRIGGGRSSGGSDR
jgi:hypothetical protein